MIFRQLFDSVSGTYSYLLASRAGGEALILDPVLEKADRYCKLLQELDLRLVKAVDTHLHADHVTGLGELRDRTQCITIMGEQSKADVVSMRVSDGDKARAPDPYQSLQVARSIGLSLDWLLLGRGQMLWVEPAPEPREQVMNALRAVITAHGDWTAEELEFLQRPRISRRLFEGFLRELTELLELGREVRRIWQDLDPELS